MHIVKKLNQRCRDFRAIYACEHCGHTFEGEGYDDIYFHEEVIPNMTCRDCGRMAGPFAPGSTPDVPEGVVL